MKIEQMEGSDEGRFYMFFDLAEKFWPGDWSHSNHDAERKVREALAESGWQKVNDYCYELPGVGRIFFDSESGGFECHAPLREPVEAVQRVIEQICTKMDAAREVLS